MLAKMNERALRDYLGVEIAAALGSAGDEMDLEALQDYIVVLLKKRDKTEAELERACEDELVDFLGDSTIGFVRKMFGAIRANRFDGRAHQSSDSSSSKRRRDDNADNRPKRAKNDDSGGNGGGIDYGGNMANMDPAMMAKMMAQMMPGSDSVGGLDYGGGGSMDPTVMAQMMAQMMPGFMPPVSYEDAYSRHHQEPEEQEEEEYVEEAGTHDNGNEQVHVDEYEEAPAEEAGTGAEEQCTLRCVGVPPHTKEDSLFRHFRMYGTVVKLEYAQESTDPEGLEYYVQFLSSAAAQKCLASPSAVLNNRHVSLLLADSNLVPLAEAQEYVEQAQTRGYIDDGSGYGGCDQDCGYGGRGGRGRGRGRFAARGGFRGGRGRRVPYGGRSSYSIYSAAGRGRGGTVSSYSSYVRGETGSGTSSVVTAAPVVAEVALPSSSSPPTVSKAATADDDEDGREGRAGDDEEDLYGDIEDARGKGEAESGGAAGGAQDAQKVRFDELKRLREEAEAMWEKKEGVITSQQATISQMIKATSNPKQLGLLEAKMEDLKAKLAELKTDRAKSTTPAVGAGPMGRGGRGFGRGGRFGRGRGGGRHSYSAARGSGGSTYVRR